MLELSNVCKTFNDGKDFAVNDVSFSVYDGECLALVGQSGGGKTTLLKLINRLLEPSSGEIHINGVESSKIALDTIRKQVGYISDQTCLFPHLTVYENINIAHDHTVTDRTKQSQIIFEIMAELKLDPFELEELYAEELTLSETFRIQLARTLATEPDILLLDNPFLGIDSVSRSERMLELGALKSKFNKTLVFASDDLNEIRAIADKIGILLDGRLLQMGTYNDLNATPKHEHITHYISLLTYER